MEKSRRRVGMARMVTKIAGTVKFYGSTQAVDQQRDRIRAFIYPNPVIDSGCESRPAVDHVPAPQDKQTCRMRRNRSGSRRALHGRLRSAPVDKHPFAPLISIVIMTNWTI